jgi:putative heme-binding domain-containing protein
MRLCVALRFSFLLSILPSLATAIAQEHSKSDYQNAALRSLGDPVRGRELFFNEERLACSRCHSTDGKGVKVGPDLFTIGDKFGRRDLIEAILSPSQTIAVGYSTTTIEENSGDTFQGIIKDVTERGVELVLPDGNKIEVPKKEIAHQTTSSVSLMPEGLQAGLSLAEFCDLVEYLVSLKLPDNVNLVQHGMPAIIPVAHHPAGFRAIHSAELAFNNPVWFGQIPGSANAFLVVEHQTGKIWRLELNPEKKTLFLDLGTNVISGGTRGLIGFVFHPKFTENRKYFVAVHVSEQGVTKTLTLERRASPDLLHDSGEEPVRILEITATSNVHYGGSLMFGPDGYLYIGMGDTGPQEDPRGNGQDRSYLRGKILRIDVDHHDEKKLYSIPQDNPFINDPHFRPEIWAYGFREPWRFSFDPVTHKLWVGDVGQDRYEEVDIVERGGNYGWNTYEGFEPFSNKYRRASERYLPPVFAYTRKYGPSVTGGFVYRHDATSPFNGAYIFGDYETRRIFALHEDHGALKNIVQIGIAPQRVVSFGEDSERNLFVVGYEGTIYRLDLNSASVD